MSAVLGQYQRLDIRGRPEVIAEIKKRKEEKLMRLTSPDETKIQIVIREAKRDNSETVDEYNEATGKATGKKIPNKRFGKMYYETAETIDVYEAKSAEVKEAVLRGLHAVSKK